MVTRREMLAAMGSAAALLGTGGRALARPAAAGPQIGVQLYMARELAAKDLETTLAAIAGTGVRHIEFAGFHDRSATQLGKILADNGLKAVGAHCLRPAMTDDEAARIIEYCAALDMPYVLAALPFVPGLTFPIISKDQVRSAVEGLTLDHVQRSADRFNRFGSLAQSAGRRFAYHTHGLDFRLYGDHYGFDEMIARTDPALVDFELDIGNTIAAGVDPLPYLRTLAPRIPLAHLKDWKGPYQPVTWDIPASAPIGEGTVAFAPILSAMQKAGTSYAFIEEEAVTADEVIPTIGKSYRYLKTLDQA